MADEDIHAAVVLGARADRAAVALIAILTCAALAVSPRGADGAPPPWPGMKECGSFRAEYRTYVYANKHVRCRKARRIMKEWWLGPKSRQVRHNGGTGASGYVTLKRFPGWRCSSGAGAGGCRKGKRFAAYQN